MERWGAYYKLKCISGWFSFSATAYKINVFTSAGILGAGTDANVFIIICGNSQTPEIHLKKSETHKDPFEKGHEDIFTYESDRNLGRLQKVHIRHDNKGKFLIFLFLLHNIDMANFKRQSNSINTSYGINYLMVSAHQIK